MGIRYALARKILVVAPCALVLSLGSACGADGKAATKADAGSEVKLSQDALDTTLTSPKKTVSLGDMIAKDRSTIFVLTGEPCDRCDKVVGALMAQAFTDPQFSVIVVGMPKLPKNAYDAAVVTAAAGFAAAESDALRSDLDVSTYPTLAVVGSDGAVKKVLPGPDTTTEAIALARGDS